MIPPLKAFNLTGALLAGVALPIFLTACTVPFSTLQQIVVVPYATLRSSEQAALPSLSFNCLQAPPTLFPVPAETHRLQISDVTLRLVLRNEGPLDLAVVVLVGPGGKDPYSAETVGRIRTPLLTLGHRGGRAEHLLGVSEELLAAHDWNLGVQATTTDIKASPPWRSEDYLEIGYQVLAQAKIP